MGNYLTCEQRCDFYRIANCRSNFEIDGLDMTLPKNLQEKRDALIIEKQSPYKETYRPLVGAMIHTGFDAACDLLLPEIKKMEKTIDNAAKYLESCGYNDVDLSEPEFQMLQSFYEALQSLREFLGSEG